MILQRRVVVCLACLISVPTLSGCEWTSAYSDGRPSATLRYNAKDAGEVLRYGSCENRCDEFGARDVWVFQSGKNYYMDYDGAGPDGWLAALATSTDLLHWSKVGPVLSLGPAGTDDSASASYGTTFFDGEQWHMFYLGSSHATSPPDRIPSVPYLTMKAVSNSPTGPWRKQPEVVPFRPQPGSYYSVSASPGYIVQDGNEYLQFFSAVTGDPNLRTIGIARTNDLNGHWKIDPQPVFPPTEQVENTSLYFEQSNKTWFMFTNHVGLHHGAEFTDAIWVYWSKDLNHWNAANKAVVLDARNCRWSKGAIGLPSVIRYGNRLAIFYDGAGGDSRSHMHRSIGLAWLTLPLTPPVAD